MLYLIATPIGNLKDITLRALEVLQTVDGIICEDTRRTSLLLQHYQIPSRHSREGGKPIKTPLIVLNDFNESKVIDSVTEKLKTGENLALVSDAGTPLISDPGYKLVRSCLEQNIPVDSIPGPSSVITALTLSGFPPDKFLFLGYPPEKPGHRLTWLSHLRGGNTMTHREITNIMFVAPHKLIRILQEMQQIFGDIEIVLAHELTKIHQSVEKKKISQWLEKLKKPKGEYVLLFRF